MAFDCYSGLALINAEVFRKAGWSAKRSVQVMLASPSIPWHRYLLVCVCARLRRGLHVIGNGCESQIEVPIAQVGLICHAKSVVNQVEPSR